MCYNRKQKARNMNPKKKKGKVFLIILIALPVLIAAAVAFYFMWEQAPQTAQEKALAAETAEIETDVTPSATPTPTPTPVLDGGVAPQNERQDGVYTVLLAGVDLYTGHTDTIVVGKVDTNAHKMDFVSIPRDTLLNMDGDMRKINAVYDQAVQAGKNGMEALKMRVEQVVGFEIDCYAMIDLDAFIEVIDAVGGIDYYVDEPIYYDDVWQNMFIYYPVGMAHLDGEKAMALVRYRAGYLNADIGRIEVQHKFLKACFEQFISLGNIPNVGKVIDILTESLDTDLSAKNIAYFMRQALMCKVEDITFNTMPNAAKTIGGYSYAVIVLYNWLDMINEYLNPYTQEITSADLDVMYNDIYGYGCTREVQGGWYYVGAAEADMAAAYAQYGYLPG